MTKKQWIIIVAVVVIGSGAIGFNLYKNKSSTAGMDHSKMSMTNQSAYKLNLREMAGPGGTYPVMKPTELMFNIQDQNNKVVKNFDVVHEKKLHLIVVRKDRTNFQHIHPKLDEGTGLFAITDLRFPTDGDYRVFADFTPSSAKKGTNGIKEATTPYQDLKAGDVNKYMPQPIGGDKLASSANGFDTNVFFAPGDDSPGGKPMTDFYAGQESTVAIEVNKGGQPYKNLQTYLGALGHMVVLGPKLEYIHAHPQTSDIKNQSGLVTFAVNFPEAGQYKLYLQTQADNQVNTTDYTLTAQSNPSGASKSSGDSMQGMDHSGH